MRDVANYQLRLNNVLSGRGLLQRVCVHKCFLTVTDLTTLEPAICVHEQLVHMRPRTISPCVKPNQSDE